MSEHKRQILIDGVIAAVMGIIVIASVVYLPLGTTTTSSSTGTSNVRSSTEILDYVPGPGCQNITQGGIVLINGEYTALAFLMKTNSQATVCVKYTLSSNIQSVRTIDFNSSIDVVNATAVYQNGTFSGYEYSYKPANGVSIEANPSSITVGPENYSQQFIVNYTITASSNAKGLYSLGYFGSCPNLIPFSVGYGTSQINGSVFKSFLLPGSCVLNGAFSSNGVLVGYGGLGTEWISTAPF